MPDHLRDGEQRGCCGFVPIQIHASWLRHNGNEKMLGILSEDFVDAAVKACAAAALESGHSVVHVDHAGRFVQEQPSGRRFEVRLDASRQGESPIVVLRELTSNAS
jgi:hypothetical protein